MKVTDKYNQSIIETPKCDFTFFQIYNITLDMLKSKIVGGEYTMYNISENNVSISFNLTSESGISAKMVCDLTKSEGVFGYAENYSEDELVFAYEGKEVTREQYIKIESKKYNNVLKALVRLCEFVGVEDVLNAIKNEKIEEKTCKSGKKVLCYSEKNKNTAIYITNLNILNEEEAEKELK